MEAERKFHDDFDIDDDFRVTVTESGQTAVHNSDASDPLDDMDFSILASGRTMETIDRPAGKSDRLGLRESSSKDASSDLDSQSHIKKNQSIDQRQRQQHQSESFQPLLPLPDHPTRPRSAPRAIPNSKPPTAQTQTQGTTVDPPASRPSSAGSTASAFLNNLLDPAASTFNNTQISHTPPNQIATSYEASHFGKRARSGVSTSTGVFFFDTYDSMFVPPSSIWTSVLYSIRIRASRSASRFQQSSNKEA